MLSRPRPTFVVSTGRCGSTLLSEILRHHPSILSLSEFFSMLGGPRALGDDVLSAAEFWALLSEADPDLDSILRCAIVPEVLASARTTALLSSIPPVALVTLPHLTSSWQDLLPSVHDRVTTCMEAPAAVHAGRLFDWLRHKFERSVWVERSGGSLEYAELLRKWWPDARFVLLLRDGCDTALSMAAHPMFRVRVARIVAGNHGLPVEECLRARVPVDRFGAYWSALMGKARRLSRLLPSSDLLVLHYEDLVHAPASTLSALAAFVTGFAAPVSWIESATKMIAPARSRWSALGYADRDALAAACRTGARYFPRQLIAPLVARNGTEDATPTVS